MRQDQCIHTQKTRERKRKRKHASNFVSEYYDYPKKRRTNSKRRTDSVSNNNLSYCFVTKAIKIIKHNQLVLK